MSTASNDRELEEALADAAQLREGYRTVSRDEPPEALDALIRAAARDEAVSRADHAASRLTASWRVPLSIAAVVVVSATVSVLVAERHDQLPRNADHSESSPPVVSKDEKRAEPGAARRQLPAAPADKSQSRERALQERLRPKEDALKEPAAAPQAASETLSEARESRPSQEPFKTQEPATQAPGGKALPSAAMQQAGPPAAASQPSEAGRPEPLSDQARSEEHTQGGLDRVAPERPAEALHKEGVAQPVTPAAAKLERDSSVAARKSASVRPAWESDPEAWLKHIDELRLAGQRADAEASFRAFRDRYPKYPLPVGFVVPER